MSPSPPRSKRRGFSPSPPRGDVRSKRRGSTPPSPRGKHRAASPPSPHGRSKYYSSSQLSPTRKHKHKHKYWACWGHHIRCRYVSLSSLSHQLEWTSQVLQSKIVELSSVDRWIGHSWLLISRIWFLEWFYFESISPSEDIITISYCESIPMWGYCRVKWKKISFREDFVW